MSAGHRPNVTLCTYSIIGRHSVIVFIGAVLKTAAAEYNYGY